MTLHIINNICYFFLRKVLENIVCTKNIPVPSDIYSYSDEQMFMPVAGSR